jgi:hypothetical protein
MVSPDEASPVAATTPAAPDQIPLPPSRTTSSLFFSHGTGDVLALFLASNQRAHTHRDADGCFAQTHSSAEPNTPVVEEHEHRAEEVAAGAGDGVLDSAPPIVPKGEAEPVPAAPAAAGPETETETEAEPGGIIEERKSIIADRNAQALRADSLDDAKSKSFPNITEGTSPAPPRDLVGEPTRPRPAAADDSQDVEEKPALEEEDEAIPVVAGFPSAAREVEYEREREHEHEQADEEEKVDEEGEGM